MKKAKLFPNGQSQAVRLPKEYRFQGDEVYIQRIGDAVILFPLGSGWEIFMEGLESFSGDYMEEGRIEEVCDVREIL